jgi:hypothetical protein
MFIIVMPTVSAASRKGPPHIHLPLFPRSKINSSRSYRLQGLPKTCAVSATLLSLHTAMGDSGTSGYICPCVVKSGRLLPAVVALECRRVPVQHACVEAKCLAVMQHPAAYCMSFFSCTREHANGRRAQKRTLIRAMLSSPTLFHLNSRHASQRATEDTMLRLLLGPWDECDSMSVPQTLGLCP